MKPFLKTLFALASFALLAGCFRNDIRTETFRVREMNTAAHEARIVKALHGIPGIQHIRPDRTTGTLTVVFDGRSTFLKNIEYAIVDAGFDLPHWPAEPADKTKLTEDSAK